MPANIVLQGAGARSTGLQAGRVDKTIVHFTGSFGELRDLVVMGYGLTHEAIGGEPDGMPTQPAVKISGSGNDGVRIIRSVIMGGSACVQVGCQDTMFEDTSLVDPLDGPMIEVVEQGQVWMRRCALDQQTPLPTVNGAAYPVGWKPGWNVEAGAVWSLQNRWFIQCVRAGKTGTMAPAIQPYRQDIHDGSATWQLFCPTAASLRVNTAYTSENSLTDVDFSNPMVHAVDVRAEAFPDAYVKVRLNSCIFGGQITNNVIVRGGSWVILTECQLGGGWADGYAVWTQPSFRGHLDISGGQFLGGGAGLALLQHPGSADIRGINVRRPGSGKLIEGSSPNYRLEQPLGTS